MILLALAMLTGFAALILWDAVWVFWLFGIGYICMGIGVGSDKRVRDRRFKTGFKGNEADTSDVAAGAKLIALGVAVCALGYFARELLKSTAEVSTTLTSWWDLYAWKAGAGLVGLLVILAFIKRILLTAQTGAQKTQEPPKDYPMRDRSGFEVVTSQLKIEQDVLRVLLYVGKADGQLRAPERSVIGSVLVRLGSNSIDTEGAIDELLARTEVPTLQAFKLAVGRLSRRDPSVVGVVLAAAEQMVATQKTVHAREQEALNYLQSCFSRASDA